jgi:hypothetical protein
MGTLRSTSVDIKGYEYKGVTFGNPSELDDDLGVFVFDHQLFPNGTVEIIDGEIVVVVDEENANTEAEEMDES